MSSEIKRENALNYLQGDALSHIDMLEPLRRGMADILYTGNDGVVLYERNSQACMISMQGPVPVDIGQYQLFAVHQRSIADRVRQEQHFTHEFEVFQAAYLKKEPLEGDFENIRPLSLAYADPVCRIYGTPEDRDYIDTLIARKQLWGIFEENKLAGFIGEHLEGSMGLLEVLPEYRRKGYGYRLEAFLINHFLRQGEIPFCQVKTGNDASLFLQRKLGLQLSPQTTTWLF